MEFDLRAGEIARVELATKDGKRYEATAVHYLAGR